MRIGRVLLAAAVAVAVVAAAAARGQDAPPPDEVVADHWFVQFHGSTGAKTGWAHDRRVHGTRDGVRVWITESETHLDRGPEGEKLEKPMRFSQRFVEDEAGKVLEYATSADIGTPAGPQTREGKLEGEEIAAIEDGKPRRVAYPAGAVGPAAVARAIAADLKPDASGRAVRFQPLDPETGGALSWRVPPKTELVDVLGRRLWLYRVEKDDGSGIPDWSFPDGRGGEWAGAVSAGVHMWFRAEEAVAKADADPLSLVTSRIVAANSPVVADRSTRELTLRLSRKGGAVGDLPEDRQQSVARRSADGSLELLVRGAEPPAGTTILARPYAGKTDHSRSLAATPLVESKHPRVKEHADAAVSELTDSLRCARMIELFVKMNLRPGAANVGFATAAETISAGAGDWTESAVLSVALARASGMPARLVAGFVHWPAADWPDDRYPQGAFAPHTWAEVLVAEDTWFPIDPLRMDGTRPAKHVDDLVGHGGFDVTHVAVLRSDLDTETPFRDVLSPVLAFLDGLSIEAVTRDE